MVGRTLAHYQILEEIGAGGMGVVYRARDTQLERSVALKVVGEQAQVGENARARLLQEARTASALNHPNICTIYEAGVADGETYIAMELVEGQPLSAMVSSNGLPVEMAIRYGVQIADALAHAHERGVVHRDLKSANVIITPEGRPKVLDFGLAKRVIEGSQEATRTEAPLTEAGTVVGTLAYMAPEVLRGERADARSDLWALGVMLYQAVTGTLPFRGSTAFDLSSAILRDSAASLPAHVPPGLAAIIQRLLSKQAGERYQRAGEVRAALETIQPSMTPSRPSPVVAVSRRRWIWAAGLIAVAAALVSVGLEWRSKRPAPASEGRLSDGNRASANREANEYYEKSLLFGGAGTSDAPQARRMLEQALALDPKFAAARAEYAFYHVLLVLGGGSSDPSLLYKAEEEVRRALQDDPGCGRAHSVLALVCLLQGRKELVPGEIDKALKANPNDVTAHSWLLLYHNINGDYAPAIQLAKQAIARWPLYWPAHLNLGELLRQQGDIAGAIREQERVLEQVPNNLGALVFLAHAYMDSGDLIKARQTLTRPAGEARDYGQRGHWALLLALEGKKAEAIREMDAEVQAWLGVSFLGPSLAAEFYAAVGETDKALEWLDRAVRMGDDREDWLRRDPLLASIRNQPRFQQMLASVAYRRKQRLAAGPQGRPAL
jgi:serine/threonine protein kinase/Tfp pilus assembly protein PilF